MCVETSWRTIFRLCATISSLHCGMMMRWYSPHLLHCSDKTWVSIVLCERMDQVSQSQKKKKLHSLAVSWQLNVVISFNAIGWAAIIRFGENTLVEFAQAIGLNTNHVIWFWLTDSWKCSRKELEEGARRLGREQDLYSFLSSGEMMILASKCWSTWSKYLRLLSYTVRT